jgi:putative ABC transport system permease protein
MIWDYFKLAFGNLRHRGLRSWLTVLGIFIGIAAVVALISMGNGLEAAVSAQFGGLASDQLSIQNKGTGFGPPGSSVVEKLNDDDIKLIESVQGVEIVIPRLIKVGSLEYNGVAGFGYSTDIPEERKERDIVYESLGAEVVEGKLLEDGDQGKVIMGNNFLEMNDFGKKFRVGKIIKINGKEFEIQGFFNPLFNFQLNSMVFMMNDDMEELYGIEGEYDLLAAKIKEGEDIEEVAEDVARKLRKDRGEDISEESFDVSTPVEAFGAVTTIVDIINLIVIGIAAISLFVGGVGIANTMYTSVLERTKEIGTMKAIGAKNKAILYVFLIESGLLGLVGGVVGASIGMFAAFGVGSAAEGFLGEGLFPIVISWPLVIGAVAFSFVVGIISGILPAYQASKLNIVDALRK